MFMWHWSADTFFDSCQLTIMWKPIIKLNTDCICPGHLASNGQEERKENLARLADYHSMRTIVAI